MASINAQKRKRVADTLTAADYQSALRFLAYVEILQTRMREDERARQETLKMELAVVHAKLRLEEVRQAGWSFPESETSFNSSMSATNTSAGSSWLPPNESTLHGAGMAAQAKDDMYMTMVPDEQSQHGSWSGQMTSASAYPGQYNHAHGTSN
ncbi:uncharacterized protein SCHCODRAFT_02621053 [Schizophyllum commune H4-8]|nr:uncharacterized protein SCHCODRAFT_02621053 [Schizophyllum commune H4-8]KAI5893175.1 hypothetical protein SCHCODRAFT_02621053 [Schizophyllum commune H4-8]